MENSERGVRGRICETIEIHKETLRDKTYLFSKLAFSFLSMPQFQISL